MGLWRRRSDDARPAAFATDADGRAHGRAHGRAEDDRGPDGTQFPPLNLDHAAGRGSGGNADRWPDDPPDVRSWRPWAALLLAIVVGAVAGVVGANARNDAIDRARVELIGGAIDILRPGAAAAADPWTAEFTVFNSGQRAVEVLSVDVDGWTFIDHGGTRESVVAEPAGWTVWTVRVSPDCEEEPADRAAPTHAIVRSGSSETTISMEFPVERHRLHDAWSWACSTDDFAYPQVIVESVEVLPREAGSDELHTRLDVAAHIFSEDPTVELEAAVVQLWAHAPGFEVSAPNLPVEFTDDDAVATADVEWRLTSCREADELDFLQLSWHVSPEASGGSARVQQTEVPARLLMELGRMVGDVCGV